MTCNANAKGTLRSELNRLVADYLAHGGTIRHCAIGEHGAAIESDLIEV